jgi:hypothetical protein
MLFINADSKSVLGTYSFVHSTQHMDADQMCSEDKFVVKHLKVRHFCYAMELLLIC